MQPLVVVLVASVLTSGCVGGAGNYCSRINKIVWASNRDGGYNIFIMDADGTVRAIHSGFSGPATGKIYSDLKEKFEKIIRELLEK